ncbi:MAG: CvpA family protein [Candidatus Omnitrophica bacterium]|nr:CvpA family protein [Candidatus Omnitrophota bacterium]
MNILNWVDILIFALLVRSVMLGFGHGFSREFINLLKMLVSLYLASLGYPLLTQTAKAYFTLPSFSAGIFFFVLIYVCVYFLFTLLLARIKEPPVPLLMNVVGGCLGLFKGAIIAFFILTLLSLTSFSSVKTAIKDKSFFAPYILTSGKTYCKLFISLPQVEESQQSTEDR